jgi:hypothetical protein
MPSQLNTVKHREGRNIVFDALNTSLHDSDRRLGHGAECDNVRWDARAGLR